jgi:hypothetical protein
MKRKSRIKKAPAGKMFVKDFLEALKLAGYKINRQYFYELSDSGKIPKIKKACVDPLEVAIALAVHQQAITSSDLIKVKRGELIDRQISAADRLALKEVGELISRKDAAEKLSIHDQFLKNLLNFKLCDQLPALNAGLDAAAQRKNCREILDDICRRMIAFSKEWKPVDIK